MKKCLGTSINLLRERLAAAGGARNAHVLLVHSASCAPAATTRRPLATISRGAHLLFALLLCSGALAQEPESTTEVNGEPLRENGGAIEDEISGFNIDQTITRTGHDFARYMSEYRNLHYPDSRYNLTVHERPSARWGNLIWVTYQQETLFRRFINPSTNNIKELAEYAAKLAHEWVQQEQVRRLLEDHYDMAKDEI